MQPRPLDPIIRCIDGCKLSHFEFMVNTVWVGDHCVG